MLGAADLYAISTAGERIPVVSERAGITESSKARRSQSLRDFGEWHTACFMASRGIADAPSIFYKNHRSGARHGLCGICTESGSRTPNTSRCSSRGSLRAFACFTAVPSSLSVVPTPCLRRRARPRGA